MTWPSLRQAEAAGLPDVPTVLLTGAKLQDSVINRHYMPPWIAAHSNWVARLPNGRHIISTNSGHDIVFLEPERVIELIRQQVVLVGSYQPDKARLRLTELPNAQPVPQLRD